ncbi:MAG: hypothetical protein ACI8S7_000019 [Candidatus Krumholzibacteriia bacterium]|jgi:hypothetical protein
MFKRPKTKLLVACSTVAVVAMAVLLAPDRESPDSLIATPGTAAMRAAIDPETGELVTGPDALRLSNPTDADKAAAMENMLSRSTEGLEEVHHPDGRVSVHLQGRFMSASVARINEEGKVETLCTEDMKAAEDFLSEAQPETDANGLEVR